MNFFQNVNVPTTYLLYAAGGRADGHDEIGSLL